MVLIDVEYDSDLMIGIQEAVHEFACFDDEIIAAAASGIGIDLFYGPAYRDRGV